MKIKDGRSAREGKKKKRYIYISIRKNNKKTISKQNN